MTASITINGITHTTIPLVGNRFGMAAYMGQSALSDVILDDDTGAISHFDLASLKIATVDEDATASPTRLYRGRIGSHTVQRGDWPYANGRQWQLQLQDYNWDLRGFRILGWDRPAETDVERVLALHAYFLNGSGSISPRKRTTTALTTTFVDAGNTVDLEAKIYNDYDVDGIWREIAEIAGKAFFVTVDGEMFYDLPTSTAYAAGLSIDPATADSETVFTPLWGVSAQHGGQEILTGGAMRWGENDYVEGSDLFGGEGFHDKWEGVLTDGDIESEAEAEQLLDSIIHVRSNEDISYACTLSLRADQVDLIKSGQTLDFRHPATDATSDRTLRIVNLQWEPDAPEHYLARLELGFPRVAAPRRPTRNEVRPKAPTPPTPGTPGTPPTGATVLWTRTWDYEQGTNLSTSADYPWLNYRAGTEADCPAITGAHGHGSGTSGGNGFGGVRAPCVPGAQVTMVGEIARNWFTDSFVTTKYYYLNWYAAATGGTSLGQVILNPGSFSRNVAASYSFAATAPPGANYFTVAGVLDNTSHDNVTITSYNNDGTPGTPDTPGDPGDTYAPIVRPGEPTTGDGTCDKYACLLHSHEHFVVDEAGHLHAAEGTAYDNTTSGLTADDVQDAIDELALGAATSEVVDHGSMGATETFDFAEGSDHEGIQDADLTVTLTGATTGKAAWLTLVLTQDGTGGHSIALPGSVVNASAVEAAWDQTPSTVNILTLFTYDGGTTWYGFLAGGSGGSSVGELDDLTDVTITTPAEHEALRFNGSSWVNDSTRWEPVTFNFGSGPELVWEADDLVMEWKDY